jgi:ribosomal protein S18 acetylase RimI-like enzyme
VTSELPPIRRATLNDVDAIIGLTDAAYHKYIIRLGRKPQPMTTDYQHFVAQHPVWLLEVQQELAGVLVLQHEADALLIYSVAIEPAYQKRGYGRHLLAWAEQQALLADYRQIRLYTNALMEENIALYQRLGYQETEREAYPGGMIVHMSKVLGTRTLPS